MFSYLSRVLRVTPSLPLAPSACHNVCQTENHRVLLMKNAKVFSFLFSFRISSWLFLVSGSSCVWPIFVTGAMWQGEWGAKGHTAAEQV